MLFSTDIENIYFIENMYFLYKKVTFIFKNHLFVLTSCARARPSESQSATQTAESNAHALTRNRFLAECCALEKCRKIIETFFEAF